jgi:hypothetical protein
MNSLSANPGESLRRSAGARLAEVSVCAAHAMPVPALRQRLRGVRRVAFARQVAMYLAHVGCGLNLSQVGQAFGRDRTTVRHACALVEDRRDQPGFDLGLSALEAGLMRLNRRLQDGRIHHGDHPEDR